MEANNQIARGEKEKKPNKRNSQQEMATTLDSKHRPSGFRSRSSEYLGH